MQNMQRRSKNIFVWSILAYPLLLFVIFYIGVNFNSLIMAFRKFDFDGSVSFAGFSNFAEFFTAVAEDGSLLNISLINSLKMYFINLIICMPLYIFFSYLLFKKFLFHKGIRAIVLIPQVVSTFVITLLFQKFVNGVLPALFGAFGVEDFPVLLTDPKYSFGTTLFYMIWISFSVSLIVYPNAMNEIPGEVMESAAIDGINGMFQELYYMILPLIFPTLSTFLITGFAGILTATGPILEFYMYSAMPEVYNMGYYFLVKVMKGSETFDYPVLAAGGLVMTLVMAPLTNLLKFFLDKVGSTVEY